MRFWLTFIPKETRSTTMSAVEVYRVQDRLVVEHDNYYKPPERVTALMEESSS